MGALRQCDESGSQRKTLRLGGPHSLGISAELSWGSSLWVRPCRNLFFLTDSKVLGSWSWLYPQPEEKGAAEDEMVGWHHWLSGRECEQTLGDSEGQRSLQSMRSQRVGHNRETVQQPYEMDAFNFKPASVRLKHYFLIEDIHVWKLFHRTSFCCFCHYGSVFQSINSKQV